MRGMGLTKLFFLACFLCRKTQCHKTGCSRRRQHPPPRGTCVALEVVALPGTQGRPSSPSAGGLRLTEGQASQTPKPPLPPKSRADWLWQGTGRPAQVQLRVVPRPGPSRRAALGDTRPALEPAGGGKEALRPGPELVPPLLAPPRPAGQRPPCARAAAPGGGETGAGRPPRRPRVRAWAQSRPEQVEVRSRRPRLRHGAGLVHGRVGRRPAAAPPHGARPPGRPGAAAPARRPLLEGTRHHRPEGPRARARPHRGPEGTAHAPRRGPGLGRPGAGRAAHAQRWVGGVRAHCACSVAGGGRGPGGVVGWWVGVALRGRVVVGTRRGWVLGCPSRRPGLGRRVGVPAGPPRRGRVLRGGRRAAPRSLMDGPVLKATSRLIREENNFVLQ